MVVLCSPAKVPGPIGEASATVQCGDEEDAVLVLQLVVQLPLGQEKRGRDHQNMVQVIARYWDTEEKGGCSRKKRKPSPEKWRAYTLTFESPGGVSSQLPSLLI